MALFAREPTVGLRKPFRHFYTALLLFKCLYFKTYQFSALNALLNAPALLMHSIVNNTGTGGVCYKKAKSNCRYGEQDHLFHFSLLLSAFFGRLDASLKKMSTTNKKCTLD